MHSWSNYNHRDLKMEIVFRGSGAIEIDSSAGDGFLLRLDNV